MASKIWNRINKPSTLVGFGAAVGALLLLMWFLEPRAKATLHFPTTASVQPRPFANTGPDFPAPWKKAAAPEQVASVPQPPALPIPTAVKVAALPSAKALPASAPAPAITPLSEAPMQRTAQPSFDCAKASGQADRLVCSDDELVKRDAELAALYSRAMGVVADRSALAAEQRDWLALRRNTCSTKPCLFSAYTTRKKELLDWVGR